MRNYPVGRVISVWLPEQADSCDYAVRFGARLVFSKFSSRPFTCWCKKTFPVGAIILGLEFFSLLALSSVDVMKGLT